MPRVFRILSFCGFLLLLAGSSCEALTSEGTEFLFVFPPSTSWTTSYGCQLIVISRYETVVDVELPFFLLNKTFTVQPTSPYALNLSGDSRIPSEGLTQRVISIHASQPISLFAYDYNSLNWMRRGHLVMPQNGGGSIFYLNSMASSYDDNRPSSYYAVMVTEADTNVTVYRKTETGYDHLISQIMSSHEYTLLHSSKPNEDHSGWKITSDLSISVISGHANLLCCTSACLPQTVGVTVLPSHALGTKYIVPGMSGGNAHAGFCTIRVVATEDETSVTYNDQNSLSINEGCLLEFGRLSFTEISRMVCTKPCSVSLFCRQSGVSEEFFPFTGTFQLSILPEHSFSNDLLFSTAIQAELMHHFLSIVVQGGETEVKTVYLDGASLGEKNWENVSIGDLSYVHTTLPITPGGHSLLVLEGNARFAAYLYGHFNYPIGYSYGYPVGFNVIQQSRTTTNAGATTSSSVPSPASATTPSTLPPEKPL